MDWLSTEFFVALLSIILIDLVLAGDNAIVIGMAARNLKKETQKQVILWGTVGAIIIRAAATLVVVSLLKIPGLLLAGGLLLIWISYKLLTEKKNHDQIEAKDSMWAAIRTIIIADAVMGLDNVIAVAGAAHGEFILVVIGLLVSVPIVVWGSTLFIKWIEKYPSIIYIGSGVLVLTAGKMITGEKFLKPFFESNPVAKWLLIGLLIVVVLAAGKWTSTVGYLVKVGERGQLTLPKELSQEAQIEPEDRFTVKMDSRGKLMLVKVEDGEDPDSTMQHAG
ncbi:YjbE family putative metal transport protein [Paenibacillus sedimenti]|uniref:YjbE family putative metal transport protein n=1 Tax=Paenibacillus sedimenti TaxID=2770274 RepID=A0A926QJW9_9BACL|nr:YjbE family putative metal transport protein [Paenibacillus sedimenti]MBD0381148.1 YjbE family putative metal transport protein [Paenibacillus sedimenti]